MKPKVLIERNLKFNAKYIYLSMTRGSIESGQLTNCDNCGKLITNMVTIGVHGTNTKKTIGTDCAETLSKAGCLYNNGTETDYQLDIYSYNKCAKVATEALKGKSLEIDMIWCKILNDKSKIVECSLSDFQKFYPELLIPLSV